MQKICICNENSRKHGKKIHLEVQGHSELKLQFITESKLLNFTENYKKVIWKDSLKPDSFLGLFSVFNVPTIYLHYPLQPIDKIPEHERINSFRNVSHNSLTRTISASKASGIVGLLK